MQPAGSWGIPSCIDPEPMSLSTPAPSQPYRSFFTAAIAVVLTVGASWGVWILWQLASVGRFTGLPINQVNAHGHAQLFGWVGLFVMGFAYQMFPAIWQRRLVAARAVPVVFGTMVAGVALRTIGIAAVGQAWAVPSTLLGGALEVGAIVTFLAQLRLTWRRSRSRGEPYLRFVGTSLAFLLIQAPVGLWHTLNTLTARSHEALVWYVATYQAVLRDLQVHGFALFMVLGVSMRVLPPFFGVAPVTLQRARVAWALILGGVMGEVGLFLAFRLTGHHAFAAGLMLPWLMLAMGTLSIVAVFRPWQPFPRQDRAAKFVRAAYLWLTASMVMLLCLPIERALVHVPFSHAFYGSIRHAITVGFISQMIVGISARVVPELRRAQATSLPSLTGTFILVNAGCFLRVTLQALTDVHPLFFRLVGVSGVLELAALAAWGAHLVALMWPRPVRILTGVIPEPR
jgi:hypothetical protein